MASRQGQGQVLDPHPGLDARHQRHRPLVPLDGVPELLHLEQRGAPGRGLLAEPLHRLRGLGPRRPQGSDAGPQGGPHLGVGGAEQGQNLRPGHRRGQVRQAAVVADIQPAARQDLGYPGQRQVRQEKLSLGLSQRIQVGQHFSFRRAGQPHRAQAIFPAQGPADFVIVGQGPILLWRPAPRGHRHPGAGAGKFRQFRLRGQAGFQLEGAGDIVEPQAGEITGLEGRHRFPVRFRKRREPVNCRDARQAQAIWQVGLKMTAEDKSQLKPGKTLPNRRGQVAVTEQGDPPGLAAVPYFIQGQAPGQQAPALRMPQGGDPGPGIMPAQGRQGRSRQEQVSQSSLVPNEDFPDPGRGGRVLKFMQR